MRRKKKGGKWVGRSAGCLEATTEGIRTGTGTCTESWRERVPKLRGCNAETAVAK